MQPPSGNRRRRRAVAATASLGLVAGGVALFAGTVPASNAAAPQASTDSSLQQAFAAASREYGVPASVLEAVSYNESRWDTHAGHSSDGGYGPMNLSDGSLITDDTKMGTGTKTAVGTKADQVGRAAQLTGLSRQQLRTNSADNIRGAAAVLAAEQKKLGYPVGSGTDAGQWYGSVASYLVTPLQSSATDFADDVFATIHTGAARTTNAGQAMRMNSTVTTPQRGQASRLGLAKPNTADAVDCPKTITCQWVPAGYAQYGPDQGDYGNHDLANRTKNGSPDVGSPDINTIVIHDTEETFDKTLSLVQDPTYVSWHYTVRSSDGLIAEHVRPHDVAWHDGDWYSNMHSIGIEHEGYAAQGASWFSDVMYKDSAKLVRYLSTKYNVPLDRAHIIGHDQVPTPTASGLPGQHWDPGPYFDWNYYFTLLKAPLNAKKDLNVRSNIVRILPNFDTNNEPITGCNTDGDGQPCRAQGSDIVYLHQQPSSTSPLVADVGRTPGSTAATYNVSDIGAQASTGTDYYVAEVKGDWTAIWWLGAEAWFYNPVKHPTAVRVNGWYVTPRSTTTPVTVYGTAYPEKSEYPSDIAPGSHLNSPMPYTIKPGQKYVLADSDIQTDYYSATALTTTDPRTHVEVVGNTRYYEIYLGHRVFFVKATDVIIQPAF